MPKKPLLKKGLKKPKFFSFSPELQEEILNLSGLTRKEVNPLAHAIKSIMDSHLWHESFNQIKPNKIREFLTDKKTGGEYLLSKAKEMLEILKRFSEYEINLLSLKYLKEELEFFAEPNSQLYSREDCESGFISEYEIAYLNKISDEQEKRAGKSKNKKKPPNKVEESGRRHPKKEIETDEKFPSNYNRTLEMIKKQPVSRSVKREKGDRERIKKELEDVFFRFAKFDDDNFNEKIIEQEKKDAVNNFTRLILKEVNLLPKKRGKYKKSTSSKK